MQIIPKDEISKFEIIISGKEFYKQYDSKKKYFILYDDSDSTYKRMTLIHDAMPKI